MDKNNKFYIDGSSKFNAKSEGLHTEFDLCMTSVLIVGISQKGKKRGQHPCANEKEVPLKRNTLRIGLHIKAK